MAHIKTPTVSSSNKAHLASVSLECGTEKTKTKANRNQLWSCKKLD